MLELDNVHAYYGDSHVLQGVSLEVRPGEIVCLLGRNGAGKSTTMRMITGFLPPSEGTVTVGGFDMQEHPIPAKRLMGYLPENAPAYTDMTVYGFLNFTAELRGLRLEQLHLDAGFINVIGKGNKERVVPVGRNAVEALNRYIEVGRPKLVTPRSPANVFLTKRGTPFASVTLWLHIKRRVRRAGATRNITPHMLRHSFATHLLESGVPIYDVQKLLGHSRVETTMIYNHVAAPVEKRIKSPLDDR